MLKDKIIDITIDQFEGGKANHKADRGGLTNFGITRPFLAWYHRVRPSDIKDEEITGMTREEAEAIYGWAFDQYRVGYLPDNLQHIFWDMCVNSGVANASKIVQRALTLLKYNVGAIDGKLGSQTLRALQEANRADANLLLQNVVFQRIAFYKLIVTNDPSQKVFLNGWINRANWFLTNRV